jgi:hypothetical protein
MMVVIYTHSMVRYGVWGPSCGRLAVGIVTEAALIARKFENSFDIDNQRRTGTSGTLARNEYRYVLSNKKHGWTVFLYKKLNGNQS